MCIRDRSRSADVVEDGSVAAASTRGARTQARGLRRRVPQGRGLGTWVSGAVRRPPGRSGRLLVAPEHIFTGGCLGDPQRRRGTSLRDGLGRELFLRDGDGVLNTRRLRLRQRPASARSCARSELRRARLWPLETWLPPAGPERAFRPQHRQSRIAAGRHRPSRPPLRPPQGHIETGANVATLEVSRLMNMYLGPEASTVSGFTSSVRAGIPSVIISLQGLKRWMRFLMLKDSELELGRHDDHMYHP